MSKYPEAAICQVALHVIGTHPGIRTSELIRAVEDIMCPFGEDLVILKNRKDTKFSQKVRNIKSHDSISHLVRTEGTRNRRWFLADRCQQELLDGGRGLQYS